MGVFHAIIVYLLIQFLNDNLSRYVQFYLLIIILCSLILAWLYGVIKKANILLNFVVSLGINYIFYFISIAIIALITF